MQERLLKELESVPDNFIIGLIVKSESYENVNLSMLDILTNQKGQAGSYITVNKPYTEITKHLNQNNISSQNLVFIDCISRKLGSKSPSTSKCIFIDSPSSLTDLGIALHESVVSMKSDKKFLLVDSLSTLTVYNDIDQVIKFVHYITGKMRLWGINGVMLSLHEGTDKKLINELSQFCDKIIRI